MKAAKLPPRALSWFLRSAVLVAVFALGVLALQGQAHAAPADTSGSRAADELAEITITATRRTETSANTPVAIDAFSGETLQTYGVQSLQDLNKIDASVTINNFGAVQQQLVIRGISSNIAATTGIYFDESPLLGGFQNNFRGDGTPGIRLIDVDHIEVLKGPQGTLFGSGSMDGTLRVISNRPNLNKFGGSIALAAAAVQHGDGYFDGSIVLNAPIVNDTFGVRLVGWGESGGGFIDQTINGRTLKNVNNETLKGGRLTALWKPANDFTLTGSVTYQAANVNGAQAWNPSAGTYNNNETSLEPYNDDYLLFNVTANYSPEFGEIIGVFTHGANSTVQSFDSTPTNCSFGLCPPVVPPLSFIPDLHFADTTGELRFVSKFSGPVQVVAGVYYESDKSTFNGSAVYDSSNGNPGCINVPDCEAKGLRNPGNNFTGTPANFLEFGTIDNLNVDQYAVYGQVDWKIIDPLTLTLGARYFSATIKDRTLSTQDIAPPNACNWVFGCVTTPYVTFDGSTRQTKTTYNIALLYNLTRDINLYARAASGFRIGGINTDYNPVNLPGVPLGFQPDSLWDYEGGIKAYFLDRKLYLDLTYYHIDWTDEQLGAVAQGAFSYTLNAGKTATDGVEFDVNYLAARGLTLTGAVSYNDARLAQTLPPEVTAAGNGGNKGSDPVDAEIRRIGRRHLRFRDRQRHRRLRDSPSQLPRPQPARIQFHRPVLCAVAILRIGGPEGRHSVEQLRSRPLYQEHWRQSRLLWTAKDDRRDAGVLAAPAHDRVEL